MRSEDLFDILVRQHSLMLTAYLRSMAFSESLVDDVFQETLITAWRRLDEFDRQRPFGPWLRGIARNTLLSKARGKRRYESHIADLIESRIAEQVEKMDTRPGDTFADRLSDLRDCVARLAADHRTAVDLIYIRGLDTNHAAAAAGLSEETFRKRLYRARLALAECLRSKGCFEETLA
ncbi:MAG: sigma-70 family RNA polymerase sigma factor [Phycisphaerales bacterium]|nr:sigma-70 family RNA polymerase sigma factor [Phycisphaerales bacterium]